jgi:tetratricopeptide (TPR) repeat protein
MGRASEAIDEYEGLADALFRDGQCDRGLVIHGHIMRLSGDDLSTRFRVARRYEDHGLREKAQDEYLAIASAAARASDFEAQLRAGEAGLRLAPNDAGLRANRDDALMKLGRAAPMEPAVEERTEGETTAESRDPESEIEECSAILEANEDHAETRRRLAKALDRAGRTEESYEQLVLAARAFIAKGQVDRALEVLETLAARRPDDPVIRGLQKRASIKRQTLKAVESVLRFDERPSEGGADSGKHGMR